MERTDATTPAQRSGSHSKLIGRVIAVVLAVVLIVSWLSPAAIVWASAWRPWRTDVSVEQGLDEAAWVDSVLSLGGTRQYSVSYHQSAPNEFGVRDSDNSGFVYVSRLFTIGPWVVVSSGTGP